jgi:hypothetical protein
MSHGREGNDAPLGRPGGVLDPRWEDALRAGQEADGDAGSVERELAVIHLLRHTAGPEALGDEGLEKVWAEIEPEVAPARWWKKFLGWRVAGPAVAAAAAAVVIVIVWPGSEPPDKPGGDEVAVQETGPGSAEILAAQFEMLAPAARQDIATRVEDGRSSLRGDLLALAVGDTKTIGGAP